MNQALYRKWRPLKWVEIVGQQHIVQTLTNAISANRVGHAYLFAGPRGTGKTTIARILAKAVNCLNEDTTQRPCNQCEPCLAVNESRFLDLIEIDAASNTSVDDVRDLRDKINFSPSQGKYKIYIIDEVHMLSTAAFNALLKTLEEPPPHAIFVLATTEIHKIPATVLSRCQRHEFRRLPLDEIIGQLKHVAEAEKIQVDDDALMLIARQSAGGMRDAISLLDQLGSTGEKIDLALTQKVLGTATSQTVLQLIESIAEDRPAAAMDSIHRALDSGADPRSLARQIVEYLRSLMLIQMDNSDQIEATQDIRESMKKNAEVFSSQDVLAMIKAFNAAAVDTRGGWQPGLSLELAVAEALETPVVTQAAERKGLPEGKKKTPAKKHAPKTEDILFQATNEGSEKGGASVSLSTVLNAWREVRSIVKPGHPSLDGLLNSCKPLEIREGELILGFASDVLVEKMEKPEQIEATKKAITEVLGVEVNIRCVVTSSTGKLPPDVNPDGMVATALQNGGELIE